MTARRMEALRRKARAGRGPLFKAPKYAKPEPEYDVAKSKRGKTGLLANVRKLVGL